MLSPASIDCRRTWSRWAYAGGVSITPSELRRDVYRLLDQILETGEPVDVERAGKLLRIAPVTAGGSKLDRVRTNPTALRGDPDDIVEMDWSGNWNSDG